MRTAAAPILGLLLLAVPALAQPNLSDLNGQELNARGLHVLVYHPYPDAQGDPWGFPEPGAEKGYMETKYQAYWYPTTVLDGIERVEGATSFTETYNAYSEVYAKRRIEDAPLRLFVNGALDAANASITVKAQAKREIPSPSIGLRVVLFEDEIKYDGGNGVDTHRFVVRAVVHDGVVPFNATGSMALQASTQLEPEWNSARLGVVASLDNRDPNEGRYRPGEVLQSTTYRFDQAGPTIQDSHGVLLETLSATWCDACVYGDGAVDELANEFGIASSHASKGAAYARPFAPSFPSISTGTWETAILAAALVCLLVALGLDLSRTPAEPRERIVRRALLGGVAALTLALLILLLYFLAVNLSIEYVFSYTRRDYPWPYRLAGLWAGQKGTLLIWAAATGLFGLAFLRQGRRALERGAVPIEAATTLRTIRRVLLLVLLGLTWATLVARTFAPSSDYLLRFRPDGNGLQPVLLTPFMVIHPPIQFLSYALTGLVFSAGIAHLATGGTTWATLIRPWARINWLLATVGLGLGGLWAYYVLNFGGFWAWDPVETANLLAWFPLTLLLHSLIHYERGEHRTVAPLFAVLALPMALFSTVATRTGLWVSVHAFTDPSKNFARDPLVRLLNILETGDLLRLLTALLVASLAAAFLAVVLGRIRARSPRLRGLALVAAILLALALLLDPIAVLGLAFQAGQWASLGRSAPIGLLILGFVAVGAVLLTGPEPPEGETASRGWRRWLETRALLAIGITLLGLAFLAVFLLDVGGVNGYDRRIFDERAPFVALPVLLVLAAHFLRGLYGLRAAIAGPAAALVTTVLLLVLAPGHVPLAVVLPALALVAGASLLKFLSVAGGGSVATKRQRVAAMVLIGGALLAFAFWGNPPSQILGRAVPWYAGFPAYALASMALLAGIVHLARPIPTHARIAALALVPCFGPWGLVTAAGLLALVLVRSDASSSSLAQAFGERRGALRKSVVYLLHFGLALGLTGYTLATYESLATEPFAIGTGSPAVRGYTFEPLDASFVGLDPDQNLPREVHTRVRVLDHGTAIQDSTLVYWLVNDGTPGHYDARVTVVRRATEDLYLYPAAIHLSGQTLTDHVNGATPKDPTLNGVELTVKVLPGVGLVWSGLWILALAMVGRLAFGGFAMGTMTPAAIDRKRPSSISMPEAGAKPTAEAEGR